jgi:hypothetical protein
VITAVTIGIFPCSHSQARYSLTSYLPGFNCFWTSTGGCNNLVSHQDCQLWTPSWPWYYWQNYVVPLIDHYTLHILMWNRHLTPSTDQHCGSCTYYGLSAPFNTVSGVRQGAYSAIDVLAWQTPSWANSTQSGNSRGLICKQDSVFTPLSLYLFWCTARRPGCYISRTVISFNPSTWCRNAEFSTSNRLIM